MDTQSYSTNIVLVSVPTINEIVDRPMILNIPRDIGSDGLEFLYRYRFGKEYNIIRDWDQ